MNRLTVFTFVLCLRINQNETTKRQKRYNYNQNVRDYILELSPCGSYLSRPTLAEIKVENYLDIARFRIFGPTTISGKILIGQHGLPFNDLCINGERCKLKLIVMKAHVRTPFRDCWTDILIYDKYERDKYVYATQPDMTFVGSIISLYPTCKYERLKANGLAERTTRPDNCSASCDKGYYGRYCRHGICFRCKNSNCGQEGQCLNHQCRNPHMTGVRCDKLCAAGRYGLIKRRPLGDEDVKICHLRCYCRDGARCNGVFGTCPDDLCAVGCKRGCREACPHRTWGPLCENECQCARDEDCFYDGNCPHGQKIACPVDNYGADCTKKCHCLNDAICHETTGHCPTGCGFQQYGEDCQQSCKKMKYQISGICAGTCHCKDDKCRAANGSCVNGCATNYYGEACQRKCVYSTYCVNGKPCHCKSGLQNCNPETGKCPDGCSTRKTGPGCQIGCKDNYWGPSACSTKCHCARPSECRVTDGVCLGPCPIDMYGDKCDERCEEDKSNNPLCSEKRCNCFNEKAHCDVLTKKCNGQCDIRYTGGYGKVCNKVCQNNRYGPTKCVGECRCLDNDLCNVTNGACVGDVGCQDGWVVPDCLQVCKYGGAKCKNSCHCRNNATCDPFTGVCPGKNCDVSYYGSDCQMKCDKNRYSKDGRCVGVCHCAIENQCRASNGECISGGCITGWDGDSCDKQCKYGIKEENCQQICHCRDGHMCDHSTGYCRSGCDTRYYGTGCVAKCADGLFLNDHEGSSCSKKCHCLNNAKCNAKSGVCESGGCSTGWKGGTCQTPCDHTKKEFEKNCDKHCHCKADEACNIVTGRCEGGCHHRYTDKDCQKTCKSGEFLANGECKGKCHCETEDQCDLITGNCLDNNCSPGWDGDITVGEGKACHKTCDGNSWGPQCGKSCHCKDDERCDNIIGKCNTGCDDRWTGPACQRNCPYGKYMNNQGNCSETCLCTNPEFCRVKDGLCTDGVCPNNQHNKFQCLKPCQPRKYRFIWEQDDDCAHDCHCMNSHRCDQINGACPSGCSRRYTGNSCNESCPDGKYDHVNNCSQTCRCANNKDCDVADGSRGDGECAVGYIGTSCQVKCGNLKYGEACRKRCQCLNDTQCNHVTGKCPGGLCNNRYYGPFCDKTCRQNKYLANETCIGQCFCRKPEECKVSNGECGEAGCQPWRKGVKCELNCVGKFGLNCEKSCRCYDNGQCNVVTGKCPRGCDDKHTGDDCQKTCPLGRFDPYNDCQKTCNCYKGTDCSIIDGICPGLKCLSVRYSGIDCQKTCEDDKYFINGICSGICRCDDSEQCNVLNGSCGGGPCKPGWVGDICNKECAEGKFGKNCSRVCHCRFNRPCTKDFGECDDGKCSENWSGSNCQIRMDYSRVTEQIGAYTGVCVAFALLAVLVGFIYQARRIKQRRELREKIIQQFSSQGDLRRMSQTELSQLFETGSKTGSRMSRSLSFATVSMRDTRGRSRVIGGEARQETSEASYLSSSNISNASSAGLSAVNETQGLGQISTVAELHQESQPKFNAGPLAEHSPVNQVGKTSTISSTVADVKEGDAFGNNSEPCAERSPVNEERTPSKISSAGIEFIKGNQSKISTSLLAKPSADTSVKNSRKVSSTVSEFNRTGRSEVEQEDDNPRERIDPQKTVDIEKVVEKKNMMDTVEGANAVTPRKHRKKSHIDVDKMNKISKTDKTKETTKTERGKRKKSKTTTKTTETMYLYVDNVGGGTNESPSKGDDRLNSRTDVVRESKERRRSRTRSDAGEKKQNEEP